MNRYAAVAFAFPITLSSTASEREIGIPREASVAKMTFACGYGNR